MTKVTIKHLIEMKAQAERICMLTCYDATFARLLDEAGVDMLLVGDTLGMVFKGEETTLGVTIDEIAYHVSAVARGSKRAHIVGDMPFMSYHSSDAATIENAGKLIRAGAHSIKMEGGLAICDRVHRLVQLGIPVIGHIGLLPQSVHAQSGYLVQGRDEASRKRILDDAVGLEQAGCFMIVLEGIEANLAQEITAKLRIPTIGIGAGVHCDGQVLVLYDMLKLTQGFHAKFLKHFAEGDSVVKSACQSYMLEVKRGTFPGPEHSYWQR